MTARAIVRAVPSARDRRLFGLGNFSTASNLATQIAGGEPGVSTGFGLVHVLRLLPTSVSKARIIASKLSSSPLGGWDVYTTGTNNLIRAGAVGAAGAQTPGYAVTALDFGRLLVVISYLDGAGLLRLLVSRMDVSSVAISGYTPPVNAAHLWGVEAASSGEDIERFGSLAFRGTPTTAQLHALVDVIRARGGVPESMDGATITHRHSVKDELSGVSNPAGRKSYGARAFTAANYLSTPNGLAGSASGFCVGLHVRPDYGPGGANGRLIGKSNGFSNGWRVLATASGWQLNVFGSAGASDEKYSPALTVTSGDYGRARFVLFMFDGTKLRTFDRLEVGTGTTVTGYAAPGAAVQYIGRDTGGNDASFCTALGAVTGHVVLTPTQIAAWTDACEAAGTIQPFPGAEHRYELGDASGVLATVLDTIGTDHLTRSGSPELAIDVATAPPAPVQLTDRATLATADALQRIGAPSVRIIDPTIDGRRTLGAQGFSASNRLQTAGGLGTTNAPFWGGWCGILTTTGADKALMSRRIDATKGWMLYQSSANTLILYAVDGSGTQRGSTPFSIPASLLNVPLAILFECTGAVLRVYLAGAQQGADVACVGLTPAATTFEICSYNGGLIPNTDARWFGSAGGVTTSGLTLAQVQQWFADVERTGRVAAIAGVTDHWWDPTTDILASGVDAVPAQVLDRVGTDHLARVNSQISTSGSFTGIAQPNAAAAKLQRSGVLGMVANQSFHVQLAMRIDAQTGITSRFRMPFSHNLVSPTRAGWDVTTTLLNSGNLVFEAASNSSTVNGTSSLSLAGLLGATMLITGVYDAGASTLALYRDGVLVGSPQACASYLPPSVATSALELVGVDNTGTYIADGMTIFAVGGGQNTIPTPAEMVAQAATFAATGVVPEIVGKTTTLTNVKSAIVGGVLPSKIADEKSGIEAWTNAGYTNLTPAQRVERVWSCENAPIWRGVNGITLPNHYSVAGGYAGDPAGFGFVWVGTIDSQAVSSTRTLVSKRGTIANVGYELTTIAANAAFQFTIGNATNTASSSTVSIASSELGKLHIIGCWFDGSKVHIAARRVEVGTPAALTGAYVPDSGAFCIGKRNANDRPADLTSFYGFIGMSGHPTVAEYQAIYDAIISQERIVSPPGRDVTVLYDATRDAAGGGLPAAITDRAGSAHLTQNGTPTQALNYSRAAA